MKRKTGLIRKTIEVWQPISAKKLTEEDAREIIHNVGGFFSTLKRWDDAEKRKEKNEGLGDI